ncbi:hypothetical protein BD560DRAFT_428954 [Blakeslea trispora]|nr:hypothetical protein BD560DRAFT_428954 [Blakeslea trispora]
MVYQYSFKLIYSSDVLFGNRNAASSVFRLIGMLGFDKGTFWDHKKHRLGATCKVMSNTMYEITRHQYKQESKTIEEKKIQRDEATSSEMERTCKHKQRHEDTKKKHEQ